MLLIRQYLAASLLTLGLCAGAGCTHEPDLELDSQEDALFALSKDVVLAWNGHTLQAIATNDGHADPLAASRTLAMVHLAIHDAVNATGYSFYERYAFDGRDRLADPVAAAASAAQHVLVQLFPAQAATLGDQLSASLAAVRDGRAEQRGIALGRRVADLVFELRAQDGSTETVPYTPGDQPGDYQYTTPDFIAAPGWENVTPFGLRSSDQFRSAPPPALDGAAYAASYAEVLSKGAVNSQTRSADESAYAQFWYEFSERGWNRVTHVVVEQERLGLAGAARLFALVNIALADSYIAGWDSKFHYDRWRPITAIHQGDSDGNPATSADPSFTSFLPTPPVQDYPSTHSALGAAAAEVLTRYFGKRGRIIDFSMTSSTASRPNLELRSFTSFEQAADENADSRVMAGIHFRFACEAGLTLGRRIGRYTFEHFLSPLH
jgi:PAP2 superfamily